MAAWLALATGYAALSEVGFHLVISPGNVAVLWPAAGLAAGVLQRNPMRRWPALLSAIAAANLVSNLAHGKPLLGMTLVFVAGNLIEPVLCALALSVQRPATFVSFLRSSAVAAFTAPAVTGVLVASALTAGSRASWFDAFRSWAIGDALGIMLVAPLCAPLRLRREGERSLAETAIALAVVLTVCLYVFAFDDGIDFVWRAYLLAPVLVFVAIRFDLLTLSGSLLVIGLVGMWSLTHGLGALGADGDQAQHVYAFQLLLAMFVIPTHTLNDLIRSNRRMTARLRIAERRFTAGVLNSPIATAIRDEHGRATLVNDAYATLTGRSVADLHGMHWSELTPPEWATQERERRAAAIDAGDDAMVMEKQFVRPDGTRRDVVVNLSFVRDDTGKVVQELVHAVDVTDDRRARDRLRHRADHDDLTGLLNRAGFERRAPSLRAALEREVHVAVVYVDLDRFKEINDRHGHAVGDQVLAAIGGRLRASVHADDLVARLGGDEFVLALRVTSMLHAKRVATRLANEVAQPITTNGAGNIRVTASIGVVLDEAGSTDQRALDDLTALSDAAMYRAKRAGPGRIEVAS